MSAGPLPRHPSFACLRGVLQLLLPALCPLCKEREPQAGMPFCRRCAAGMLRASEPWCPSCCLPYDGVGPSHLCARCRHQPPRFHGIRAWGIYRGNLARAIHQFKYAAQMTMRRALQDLAVEVYREALADTAPDVVVPVPCHSRTLRQRGADLPALLSRAVSRYADLPWLPTALQKVVETPDLVRLGAAQRAQAVSHAYRARTPLHGNVLLVDDVVTTTATARVCAAACHAAGADQVWVLALARTPDKLHGQQVLC